MLKRFLVEIVVFLCFFVCFMTKLFSGLFSCYALLVFANWSRENEMLVIASCVQLPFYAARLACVFVVLVAFVFCNYKQGCYGRPCSLWFCPVKFVFLIANHMRIVLARVLASVLASLPNLSSLTNFLSPAVYVYENSWCVSFTFVKGIWEELNVKDELELRRRW